MEIEDWKVSQGDLMRIIQESVPGKQITMAHIIASPDEIIYKNWGWTQGLTITGQPSEC